MLKRLLTAIALTIPLFGLAAPLAAQQGDCVRDTRWQVDSVDGTIRAIYATCAEPVQRMTVSCHGGGNVSLWVEETFAGLRHSTQTRGELIVDGVALPIRLMGVFNDALDGVGPLISLDDRNISAMMAGANATLDLPGGNFSFHLTGSAAVLAAMLEGCPA